MVRHYAYYSQDTGAYLREVKADVRAANISRKLMGTARLRAMDAWATAVSKPAWGEVALDVTQFNYPEGDFVWSRFDAADRMLVWDDMHYFVEVDLAHRMIVANQQSPRPIRPVEGRAIIDITGTWLQPYHGFIFGSFADGPAGVVFEPRRDDHQLCPPTMQRLLEASGAALPDLILPKEAYAKVR